MAEIKEMKMNQYKVIFSGRVQGIGFRFTAIHLSRQFSGLTGYVKNMPDGSVELVAECSEETFHLFLKVIQESNLGRGIDDVTYKTQTIEERSYKTFEIDA